MSLYAFCPVGGQKGISVQTAELEWFAKNYLKSKYLDAVILLPSVPPKEQMKRIKTCKDHDAETIYWERENGKHGWCCSHCGFVTQWG